MPQTIRSTSPKTLLVKRVDSVYEFNGRDLSRVLKSLGVTQAELARECGYSGASRICHLVNGPKGNGGKQPIRGKALLTIVSSLNRLGATIEGFESPGTLVGRKRWSP